MLLLTACIAAKQPFVIDNTNPSIEERARYLVPARAGLFRVVGYYFQSRLEDAFVRNAQRVGKELISTKGIGSTYKKLQLPSLEEGFDALFYVFIVEGKFQVQEWNTNAI
jgi:hypothetical protein